MGIKQKIFIILKNIDIFGFNFPLRYRNETEYNTECGIFFSIISITFIFLLSFLYLKEMIYKTNFSLVTNYVYSNDIKIDLSSYPLMIGIINYQKEIQIDNSYVTFKIDLNNYTHIKNKLGYIYTKRISNPIEFEYCSLNNFGLFSDLFTKYEYTKNICIKPNQNIIIKGRHGDLVNEYISLEIHLVKCKNSTENNNYCKTDEEINEYLDNTYLSLFYISQTADHSNISNPVYNKLNSDSFTINTNNIKRYHYFFSKEKYINDNGILFPNNREFNLFQFHHKDFDLVEKNAEYSEKMLFEISITCNDFITYYNRVYIKLPDVIGIIGGIFDIISLLFQFISYPFVKKSFIIGIGNSFISSSVKSINNNTITDSSNENILKLKFNKTSVPFKSKRIENINICTLFNIKVKNNILTKININNEQLKMIQKFEKKEKNWYFNLIYYIIPICMLNKLKKYKTYEIYLDIFQKFLSIDFFIPMILHSYQSIKEI